MSLTTIRKIFIMSFLFGNVFFAFPLPVQMNSCESGAGFPADSAGLTHKEAAKGNAGGAAFDSLFMPGFGSLDIRVNPQNTMLRIILRDSTIWSGQGNIKIDSLKEEVYKVFVELPGYVSENRSVLISAGENTVTSFTMEKLAGGAVDYLSHNMVLVKGGSFIMGSNNAPDEQPPHEVVLPDFYIGKYEVTQEEWINVVSTDPSHWKGNDLPMENVSWDEIQQFLQKLNEKSGHHFRLPTEAEWEYAARGGGLSKRYQYSGGDSLDEIAWYENNSDGRTHKVGELKPNELGLYDMSGNVWEWCQDWYDPIYYRKSPKENPQGPALGETRVLRGGSWYDDEHADAVSFRNWYQPWRTFRNDGFRLAESK